jgi:hypothetical protein
MDICMFAWYNEVSLTVDPITSGYQLALVYDVIPTSSAFPRLPVLQPAISELRKVLQKWSKGHYTDDSGLNLVAIVLTRKYDGDLALKTLKGEDLHRVSHISAVAAEMGYVAGLARLKYRNLGIARGDMDRCLCECCESRGIDGEGIEMLEVNFTCITIENIVDLAGLPMPGFAGYAKLELSEVNLIFDNPFENQKPDIGELHTHGFFDV